MTSAQEHQFRNFLEGVSYHGKPLTEAGINTRVARCKQAEEIVKMDVESVVSTDAKMRQVLLLLRASDNHGGRANAVRKYYEMRRGKVFQRICDVIASGVKHEKTVEKGLAGGKKGAVMNGIGLNEVLKEFHRWLIEEAGLMKTSADQYKGYVKKLSAAVDSVFGAGWFESLRFDPVEIAQGKRKQCSAFIEYNVCNAPKNGKKTWGDWRSAFRRFEEFLDDVTDFWNVVLRNDWKTKKPTTVEVVPPAVKVSAPSYAKTVANNLEAVIASYEHKDLVRIFIGRLKTQSRYYPDFKLLFPTRLLTKIFRKKHMNAWIEWLKSDIENMRVLSSANGGFVRLADVASMVIRGDGKVDVMMKNGESFELMTRTASASKKIVCEVTQKGLRDISIDHVASLENVLRNNKDNLLGLQRLTELFTVYKHGRGVKLDERAERTWVNDFFAQFKDSLDTEEMRALLKADLQVLDLEYELMDTRENSKKGKGK